MSATHSDAYNCSPGEARPTLGPSVRAILAGWYRAARSTSGPRRVRALLFFAAQAWEFRWEQDVLHRVFPDQESRPATTGEWELLSRAISYGWLLVYLMDGEGREVQVLHQTGTRVPAQPQRPEDLPLLLQEHEVLSGSAAGSPHVVPGRAETAAWEGTHPSSSPGSLQDRRTDGHGAVNPGPGRRPGTRYRFLAGAGIVGQGTLLLGSILVFTRNPWVCLGTLGLLAILVLVLRRLCRSRTRAVRERAQSQTPGPNR